MIRRHLKKSSLLFILLFSGVLSVFAEAPYLEPGQIRLSHTLILEGLYHSPQKGVEVLEDDLQKRFLNNGNKGADWESDFGTNLLTDVAARITPEIAGRVLFDIQGSYADRFWRPNNINHFMDDRNEDIRVRQAEGGITKENWYVQAFQGVSRPDWQNKGDLFALYPAVYPERDYLGSSSYIGIYPENWRQDNYLNLMKRSIPRGVEGGINVAGVDGAVTYGDELGLGYRDATYGRLTLPFRTTRLTYVYKTEIVPYSFDEDTRERDEAMALSWKIPVEDGPLYDFGVMYRPFRSGQDYLVESDAPGGTGIQGSSHNISSKKSKDSDGLGYKFHFDTTGEMFKYLWTTMVELEYKGVLAGNREQADVRVGTDLTPHVKANVQYTYRKPLEGPIPFLYEGTPDNIGNIVTSPRGPESPFTVDWTNREAVFVVTTLQYDGTEGTNMFLMDPTALASWNVNPEENAKLAIAVQHRASDYRTSTDRQYYYDVNGNVVWEGAGSGGAWPSDTFLNEFRLLVTGKVNSWKWTGGIAGGQTPAVLGVAYSTSSAGSKPITEYISFELRVEKWPMAYWGHYGSGMWGPEENIHPQFGNTYDRLFGLGVSYNITVNTTLDVSYLGARQDDTQFFTESLGSFDEFRTLFSHRFGFLFEFNDPSRSGTKVR